MKAVLLTLVLTAAAGTAAAAPVALDIESQHTYPSFEADHMGLSIWRGKFNRTTGKIVLDRTAGSGTVDVHVDATSIDFGHDKLNAEMAEPKYFDTAKFPEAVYKGKLAGFKNGAPTRVDGELTLHGTTKPVALEIRQFKCIDKHPYYQRQACGADAFGTFRRDDFGIDAGKDFGLDMTVTLRISVEAVAAKTDPSQPSL
ncbi:MAG TPA: YceI family protein [Tahibacter sp.]|nr:YceI family protein [Tahibacter sp.]